MLIDTFSSQDGTKEGSYSNLEQLVTMQCVITAPALLTIALVKPTFVGKCRFGVMAIYAYHSFVSMYMLYETRRKLNEYLASRDNDLKTQ